MSETIETPVPVTAETMPEETKEARRVTQPTKKPKNKLHSKQPKRTSMKFISTEIRCQEKSKGGLAYEVILANPVVETPPKRPISPTSKETPPVSAEDIVGKLQAAEDRRRSMEKSKMAALHAKLSKIEEAGRKKDEATTQFIATTREALEHKMDSHIEKRELYINELRAKLKDHFEGVEKTRSVLDQQTAEIKATVEEKLATSAAKRDENMKKMLHRLKDHEMQVASVRANLQEKKVNLEQQIQRKLDLAESRRQHIEEEQREKLSKHNVTRLAEVQSAYENIKTLLEERAEKELKQKLELAEQNRVKYQQQRLEKIHSLERRAELVRQNKERLSAAGPELADQQTASSG